MKTYKIFLKRDRNFVIQDLQVVNKGFSIWACLLQVFYLGYQKLRIQTEIMILVMLLLNLLQLLFVPLFIIIIFEIFLCFYIGFKYPTWKTDNLLKNGYEYTGEMSGTSQKQAKLDFLEKFNSNYINDDKLEQKIF